MKRVEDKNNREYKKHYINNGSGYNSILNYATVDSKSVPVIEEKKMSRKELKGLVRCKLVVPVLKTNDYDTNSDIQYVYVKTPNNDDTQDNKEIVDQDLKVPVNEGDFGTSTWVDIEKMLGLL